MTRRAWLPAGIGFLLAFLWTIVAIAQHAASKAPPSPGKGTEAPAQSAPAHPNSLLPLTATDVLTHVRRSVDWYRDLAGVEEISLPGVDPLARSQLQQQALTAVHLAFEFGKAAEDVLGRQAQAQAQANARKQSAKPASG